MRLIHPSPTSTLTAPPMPSGLNLSTARCFLIQEWSMAICTRHTINKKHRLDIGDIAVLLEYSRVIFCNTVVSGEARCWYMGKVIPRIATRVGGTRARCTTRVAGVNLCPPNSPRSQTRYLVSFFPAVGSAILRLVHEVVNDHLEIKQNGWQHTSNHTTPWTICLVACNAVHSKGWTSRGQQRRHRYLLLASEIA